MWLKIEEFYAFMENWQIQAQRAHLIPTLKTGDEMALTSIFLSTLRLVKEYRNSIFKDIKLTKSWQIYYFTELCIPEISKSRIDWLIIVVKTWKIVDACLFEMKNKKNTIDLKQVKDYIELGTKLGIKKLVTVSNEFVSKPEDSPIKIRTSKHFSLLHFSWAYLITKWQLLLFKNDNNIKDADQIEIMRESLEYLENPISWVSWYTQMKKGWKELAEYIRAQKPIKLSEKCIEDSVISWYQEEKDISLLMSRKLWVLVKSSSKNDETLKKDIKRLHTEHFIVWGLSVKNSVSDIKMIAEFERRTFSLSIKIIPPLDKGTAARISWITRQLENSKKKSPFVFEKIYWNIWIEANVKFAKKNIRVKIDELSSLKEQCHWKEIQSFHILVIKELGSKFASTKKFIEISEQTVLEFYEGIVQNMTNWTKPTPKLVKIWSKK